MKKWIKFLQTYTQKAKTEDEAREIVNDGSTPNETIVDANHFQITEVYEESNE